MINIVSVFNCFRDLRLVGIFGRSLTLRK